MCINSGLLIIRLSRLSIRDRYGRLINYFKLCLGLSSLTFLMMNCAPSPTEKEMLGRVKGKLSLRLSDGSPISLSSSDEYNPYIVKLTDNYLVVVFGSNRSCGSCTGHNIFMAKSITPYSGLTLPFFNAPTVVTNSSTPLNQSQEIRFAAVASTTNVLLYLNNNAGTLQKGTITNPSAPNLTLSNAANTSYLTHQVIGVTAAGGDLVTTDASGVSYLLDPNSTAAPTAYGQFLDSAVSATQVRLGNSGYDDSYMAVSGAFGPAKVPIATTKSFPFGPIINFDLALKFSNLSITHINTFYGSAAADDIVLFSARDSVSADLYVVTSHTSKTLWDSIASSGSATLAPPPPAHWFQFESMLGGCAADTGFAMTPWSTAACTAITLTPSSYNISEFGDLTGTGNMNLGTVDFNPLTVGFTIAAWVKVSATCTANCTIVANSDSAGVANGFRFYYDSVTNKLKFWSKNTTVATAESVGAEIVENGATWQHVAVVANPAAGYAYLYVGGNFVGLTTLAQTNFPANTIAYMGQSSDAADGFIGGIDDLMVFESELTDAEIHMLAMGF